MKPENTVSGNMAFIAIIRHACYDRHKLKHAAKPPQSD